MDGLLLFGDPSMLSYKFTYFVFSKIRKFTSSCVRRAVVFGGLKLPKCCLIELIVAHFIPWFVNSAKVISAKLTIKKVVAVVIPVPMTTSFPFQCSRYFTSALCYFSEQICGSAVNAATRKVKN